MAFFFGVQFTFGYTLISLCNKLSSLTEHDTRVTAKERQKKDNHNLSKRAFAQKNDFSLCGMVFTALRTEAKCLYSI